MQVSLDSVANALRQLKSGDPVYQEDRARVLAGLVSDVYDKRIKTAMLRLEDQKRRAISAAKNLA